MKVRVGIDVISPVDLEGSEISSDGLMGLLSPAGTRFKQPGIAEGMDDSAGRAERSNAA